MKWTTPRIEAAVKELRKGPTVKDAIARLEERWGLGVPIRTRGMRKAFANRGLGSPNCYLPCNAPLPGESAEDEPVQRTATEPDGIGAEIPITWDLEPSPESFTGHTISATEPAPPPPDIVEESRKEKAARALRAEHGRLIEMLRVEREKNAFLAALESHREPPKILRRETASGLREATALVLASDWHPEEKVEAIKVQGKNEYNLTIADERIGRFFQGAIDLVEHHRASGRIKIRDMTLCLMGDLITGHIHEELAMSNELTPIETILWLTPRLRDGIATLVDRLDLESLTIPCDIGNHGRTTKKRLISMGPETSYEYGMYCTLARDFANDPRVHFDTTPANDHYVQIYDQILHTTHGDSVNYWGGVGGLTIPLNKACNAWNTDRRADVHAIGHFHTSIDLGHAIVNGSLIGWSPFSKWIKANYSEGDLSQHFSLIDAKRGRCHSTRIWVAKRPPPRAA